MQLAAIIWHHKRPETRSLAFSTIPAVNIHVIAWQQLSGKIRSVITAVNLSRSLIRDISSFSTHGQSASIKDKLPCRWPNEPLGTESRLYASAQHAQHDEQSSNREQDRERDKLMKRDRERTKGALVCITSFSCLFTPHLSPMRPCNRLLMPLHGNRTHTLTFHFIHRPRTHTHCSGLAQN